MEVENLSLPGTLDSVSFSIHQGEILGVFGLLGSGIDQLGRAIYGALGPLPGARIALEGTPYIPADPRQGRDAGIGFVAAERQREGIVPDLGVSANITLPFIDRFVRLFSVSKSRESSHAQSWIDRLEIRAAHLDQPLRLLSGGNQQKACLARWLVEGLKVLILEEPTRGVDVGARHELYLALRQWTQQGLAVLLISSDAEEVAGVCDRSIVLDRGRVPTTFLAARPRPTCSTPRPRKIIHEYRHLIEPPRRWRRLVIDVLPLGRRAIQRTLTLVFVL